MEENSLSGAPGGNWRIIGEQEDSSIVKQLTLGSCGPACAETVFRKRGIFSITQEMVIKEQEDDWSDVEILAEAMNSLHRQVEKNRDGYWKGRGADPTIKRRQSFEGLLSTGIFMTSLKSKQTDPHMVVVLGKDEQGRIIIGDPHQGTRYLVRWRTFWGVWLGFSVWWSKS